MDWEFYRWILFYAKVCSSALLGSPEALASRLYHFCVGCDWIVEPYGQLASFWVLADLSHKPFEARGASPLRAEWTHLIDLKALLFRDLEGEYIAGF